MKNIDLKGLLGTGISAATDDLAKYTATNTVHVEAHVGRNRGIVPLPEKQLGLKADKMSEAGKTFYTGNMQAGRLCLIPQEDEAALSKLESRLRSAITKAEICDGLIPIASYDELKKNYEELRAEYFNVRDDVLSRWDALVEDFKLGAEQMLQGVRMRKRDRAKLYQEIVRAIPNRAAYARSFYMKLNVTAFPAVAVPEGLNSSVVPDIESSWEDTVVSTALKAIETTIGNGFAMLGKAASSYEARGSVASNTLSAMERFASDMKWKNVFRNPALSAMEKRLMAIGRVDSPDRREALVEEALVDLWGYGKEMGFDLDASVTPFDAQKLDDMLAVQNWTAARQTVIPDTQSA